MLSALRAHIRCNVLVTASARIGPLSVFGEGKDKFALATGCERFLQYDTRGLGERHAMRQAVLRALTRDRPPTIVRGYIKFTLAHTDGFTAALAQSEQKLDGAAYT